VNGGCRATFEVNGAKITCESHKAMYTRCPAPPPPMPASHCSVTRQISKAPCILGNTFGCEKDRNMLWVDGSCRADFRLDGADITCGSIANSGRYTECSRCDFKVTKQLSTQPCIRGKTFGCRNNKLWVRNGCRAVFEVNGEDIECGSRGSKFRECTAPPSGEKRPNTAYHSHFPDVAASSDGELTLASLLRGVRYHVWFYPFAQPAPEQSAFTEKARRAAVALFSITSTDSSAMPNSPLSSIASSIGQPVVAVQAHSITRLLSNVRLVVDGLQIHEWPATNAAARQLLGSASTKSVTMYMFPESGSSACAQFSIPVHPSKVCQKLQDKTEMMCNQKLNIGTCVSQGFFTLLSKNGAKLTETFTSGWGKGTQYEIWVKNAVCGSLPDYTPNKFGI